MYFTNEQVVDEVNKTISSKMNTYGGDNLNPKLEDILSLLIERKPVNFFYLTTEQVPIEGTKDSDGVPTINMRLNQFFVHPLGDEIWTDDDSFKFIDQKSYEILKDSINNSIIERFSGYKVNDYTELVEKLNSNKKVGS
jgi:hypothetical protein